MNDMTRPTGFQIRHTNSGVDEFLRRADEVYEQQRKVILDREAAYQARRTEVTTSYARKMSDIANEGADALHKLDAAHRADMLVEQEKLEALGRMRNA